MLVQITAQDFYNRLIQSGIINSTGNITFNLNGISMQIDSKDSIGNMLQDWLGTWATSQNIYLRANPSTQEFPDFYLSDYNDTNFLEIKSFDYNASPNFDIANFETYIHSLLVMPKKLDADYIVFGYTLRNGILTIEKVWLKKIWELTTYSEQWDLRIQQKKGTIYNIRPVNFKSTNPHIAQPFATKLGFLNAIQSVLNQYNKTHLIHNNWLKDFKIIYQTATGNTLL
jgi:type II restriction enzyme